MKDVSDKEKTKKDVSSSSKLNMDKKFKKRVKKKS